MRPSRLILVLLVLLAMAAVALAAEAQVNPPTSGDWVIPSGDTTAESGKLISITGSIFIQGTGSLTLSNVDLRFTGSALHTITSDTPSRLSISGGRISSTGTQFSTNLRGRVDIDGCAFTDLEGLNVFHWRTHITNCTIADPSGTGISFVPTGTYPTGVTDPVLIRDNNVTNPGAYGIDITVDLFGDADLRIACQNNSVTGAIRDGIRVTAATGSEKGRYILDENRVWLSGGHGINVLLPVRVVEIRIDDIYVKNNTLDGIHVVITCSIHLMKNLDGVTAIGNVQEGVYIQFTQTHWYRPEFDQWHIEDNAGGGIHFINFNCATMENSYNVNEFSPADYTLANTVLDIYGTTHRKAQARVSGTLYHATSYRILNFIATWQNGIPCRNSAVEFEDTAGERLFQYTSDSEGWLGNHTEWDWQVTSTRSYIRDHITAFLRGGTQRLPGPSLDFDRDYIREPLVFVDTLPPDLKVEKPSSNWVQSDENLTVSGTCLDAHSYAKVVQVSFDTNADWSKKAWYNASGTAKWEAYFDPWPDGQYTVFVRAFDFANWPNGIYSNITIINVTVDTTPPSLLLIQPPEDVITNQTQLTVLGTTDPDVVSLTINGEVIHVSGSTFNKAVKLNEGRNTLVIVATDFAGNIAKVFRNLTLDSIAPILHLSYPPDGLRTNVRTLVMGGFTDVEGVRVKVNDESVPVTGGTWSHRLNLTKGSNTIQVSAVDIAENYRYVPVTVIYDPDPPIILVSEPSTGAVINTSKFRLLGSTDPDIRYNQISVNEIIIGVVSGVFDSQITIVEDGPLDLVIVAVDLAGNEASVTVPVFIDTTAPFIQNISVQDGDIVNTRTLTVSGVTEPDATLFVQSNVVQLFDGAFSTQVSLKEGENTVTLRVRDVAGNTRVITRIVTLDTLPPTLFLDNIVGNVTWTDKRFYTISGNTESTATLNVTYGSLTSKITENVFINVDGDFSHPIIMGKNKTVYVTLTVTDYAENVNEMELLIKRRAEEEPSIFKENPSTVWGIIIIVVVVLAVYPVTRYMLEHTYQSRLKRMGVGPSETPAPSKPPARPRAVPPRPDEEGAPRRAPRPPRPEEGAPKAPPRPPRTGE